MAAELWAAVAAILGVGGNSGWALRLESKSAQQETKLDGVVKITDERHADICRRFDKFDEKFDKMDGKIDRLLER